MPSFRTAVRDRFARPLAATWRRDRWVRWLLAAGAVVLLVAVALVWPYVASFGDIGAAGTRQPSRLWARPLELAPGERLPARELLAHLGAMGYQEATAPGPLLDGRFRHGGGRVEVALRRRMSPAGEVAPQRLEVAFADGAVAELLVDGVAAEHAYVGAPLLGSYYGEDAREVWPVRVDELPEHVVAAVLTAEDRGFFRHAGVSPSGIARAAVVNVREGGVEQGGSTITQQLVKNVYLTQERTLARKLREVPLALLVEAGHDKATILQAYLDQIYLGAGPGVSLHGIGAASRAYFAKDARDLTLAEAALLAGMIRNPAGLMPTRHPEAAKERRDWVLDRMAERERISPAERDAAKRQPVTTRPGGLGGQSARHFAVAAAAEARERFGVGRLGGRGVHLFSTLAWRDQAAAERAVTEGLAALGGELEAALVSVDPRDGAIRAYVGGRDWATSEFDRVRLARRQPGSVFKPIVLATALASGKVTPASLLRDAPLAVESGGETWSPRNDDGRFLGWVTVRRAVEDSRNVPIARLALDVGLAEVAATGERLGLAAAPEPYPAMALGAFEASPLEIATVYSTLAAGGRRPAVHALAAVVAGDGTVVASDEVAAPVAVLDPRIAYLTTHVLEGVIQRGTGRGVRRYDVSGAVAGKTGTSNGARDSWFAGYRPDRVTVVWVGHDEPRPTRLSGARAALPLWGRYAQAALPAGVERFAEPPGIERATVCRDSGRLARPQCPTPVDEAFLPGQVPAERCHLHQVRFRRHRPGDRAAQGKSWLERKLEDLFDF